MQADEANHKKIQILRHIEVFDLQILPNSEELTVCQEVSY